MKHIQICIIFILSATYGATAISTGRVANHNNSQTMSNGGIILSPDFHNDVEAPVMKLPNRILSTIIPSVGNYPGVTGLNNGNFVVTWKQTVSP